jgi:hypothetical protein
MKAHKGVHKNEHHKEAKKPRISNAVFGVISIFAIFFIVWLSLNGTARNNAVNTESNSDSIGQAAQALYGDSSDTSSLEQDIAPICKVIVGKTTSYDGTILATSLSADESTYYSGYTVGIKEINNEGCVVDINGNSDYLAIGQIQKIGPLYVTVTDILK